MAIDTQNKRRSVQGYTAVVVYPVADGAITKPDREHAAWLYAGIPADGPAPPPDHAYGINIGHAMGWVLAAVGSLFSRN